MGQAIGQTLVLAVAVGLSPIPIVGVVLMLSSKRASLNTPLFLVGWIVGLVAIGVIVMLVASGAGVESAETSPKTWVSILRLVLGLLLIAFAAKEWSGRPREGEEPKVPGWMSEVDHFSGRQAAMLGFALSAINPKCLLMAVAAAMQIAQVNIDGGERAIAYAVFTLIASIGVALPAIAYFTMKERVTRQLASLKAWMERNNNAILAVIYLLIGVKLVGDAIGHLW